MLTHSQFKTLFDYHFHATGRLLAEVAHLTDSQLVEDPGYGRDSITINGATGKTQSPISN